MKHSRINTFIQKNSMAKKARCYEVSVRNGHGTYSLIIPAESEAELRNRLGVIIQPNERLMGITHLGHYPFSAALGADDRLIFLATVNGYEVEVNPAHPSYDYLRQHFPDQVKDVETYFKEQYD